MKPLITISNHKGSSVVSARGLHQFLVAESASNTVGEKFTDWIKRMLDYGFEKGLDFEPLEYNYKGEEIRKSDNQRVSKRDYLLSIECAKEISMVQRNDKGKQARKYFIAVEKKAKQLTVPTNPLDLLKLAVAEMEKKDQQIAVFQPKAELMDRILDTGRNIDIGQAAKILNLPFGRNTMFEKLRNRGILFKNRNEPKQEYVNRGYFLLKEKFITRSEHPDFVVLKVLVTQKGLEFLGNAFKTTPVNKQLALIN